MGIFDALKKVGEGVVVLGSGVIDLGCEVGKEVMKLSKESNDKKEGFSNMSDAELNKKLESGNTSDKLAAGSILKDRKN